MDLTSDLAACWRAERMREAAHERLANAADRAGHDNRWAHRAREAAGLRLIRAGLRLVGPAAS